MKLSICLDAVFEKHDFIESMKSAKKLGLDTIEFWGWWDKNIDDIITNKDELGMKIAAFCTKFISLTDETQHFEYLEGLKASIKTAKDLDCHILISQVGDDTGKSRQIQHENIVNGLKMCVEVLEEADVTLVIEPLNIFVDHKGYYLSSSNEAFDLVKEVGSDKVKVLYDVYHQSVTKRNDPSEKDIISTITENIDLIGHFHVAGCPGRGEIYTGDVDYIEIFRAIDATNYNGSIGLEYFPLEDPIVGLESVMRSTAE